MRPALLFEARSECIWLSFIICIIIFIRFHLYFLLMIPPDCIITFRGHLPPWDHSSSPSDSPEAQRELPLIAFLILLSSPRWHYIRHQIIFSLWVTFSILNETLLGQGWADSIWLRPHLRLNILRPARPFLLWADASLFEYLERLMPAIFS